MMSMAGQSGVQYIATGLGQLVPPSVGWAATGHWLTVLK